MEGRQTGPFRRRRSCPRAASASRRLAPAPQAPIQDGYRPRHDQHVPADRGSVLLRRRAATVLTIRKAAGSILPRSRAHRPDLPARTTDSTGLKITSGHTVMSGVTSSRSVPATK